MDGGSKDGPEYDGKGNMAHDHRHDLPERDARPPRHRQHKKQTVLERPPYTRPAFDWLGLGQENHYDARKELIPVQRPRRPLGKLVLPEDLIDPSGRIPNIDASYGPRASFDPPSHHYPQSGRPTGGHPPNSYGQRAFFDTPPSHNPQWLHPGYMSTPDVPYDHGVNTPQGRFAPWAPPETIGSTAPDDIQEPPESQSMAFDMLHDPSEPAKDVIIKVNLPIKEDFQPNLEEFCRLRRLGRFKDAKEHFEKALKHLRVVPYVLVQYAEMLLASGDYKCFRSLRHWEKYPSIEAEETTKDPCLDKLEGNFWLLDFLAKVPHSTLGGDIFQAITNIIGKLSSEPSMGSTETQMISLCLTILGDLQDSLGDSVTKSFKDEYVKHAFSWEQLYHRLLGENRIWDLRDILVAAIPLFGTSFLAHFVGVASFPKALDKICEDWRQPEDDESTNLGLLDLFTSLLLETPPSNGRDRKAALLLEYSKSLAESVQSGNRQHMRTRPFIQWIIVKAMSEMGAVPSRPDGLTLQDFPGLSLPQRRGVHLPIFIPEQPSDKPHWDMFSVRPNPQQRQALQVALQAARYTGDYRLQAISLKLLILTSQEPKALMDALANLQLDTQGDNEGFLETCLSKYLALGSDDGVGRAALSSSFAKLGKILSDEYPEPNQAADLKPSFQWAGDAVTRLLAAHGSELDGPLNFAQKDVEFWNLRLTEYGKRLPSAVTNFIRTRYDVRIPTPIQPPPIPVPNPRLPSPVFGEFTDSSHRDVEHTPRMHPFAGNPAYPDQRVNTPNPMTHPYLNPFTGNPTYPDQHVNTSNPMTHPYLNPFAGNPAYLDQHMNTLNSMTNPHLNPSVPAGGYLTSRGFYSSLPPKRILPHPGPSTKPQAEPTGTGAETDSEYYGYRAKHDKEPATAGKRQTTTHIDNTYHPNPDSYSDGSYSDSYERYPPSDSFKPPAPDPSDSEAERSVWSTIDDLSDAESEASITHMVSPRISMTKIGNRQSLRITSKLAEENELSISMTNKADPTKSKAYTVKNGVVSEDTVPGPGRRTHQIPHVRRTESQSSLKTVRPLPAPSRPRCWNHGERMDGPSVVHDEETTDEELSTVSGRVQRAERYMSRKADEWLSGNRTKSHRPSIVQPRPVRPSPPGGLANAILTDDEEKRGEAGDKRHQPYASSEPEDSGFHPEIDRNKRFSDTDIPTGVKLLGWREKSPEESGHQPTPTGQDRPDDITKGLSLKGKRPEQPELKPPDTWQDRLDNQLDKLPERIAGNFNHTLLQEPAGKERTAKGSDFTPVGENIWSEDEGGKERQEEMVQGTDKLTNKEKQSGSDTDSQRTAYRRGTIFLK